ncbi:hypothetical protein TNCV_2837991 [Trichonephila clavipes]|nr:hypothetical protein TNCV_2837991 [Trichonephila clavipes]
MCVCVLPEEVWNLDQPSNVTSKDVNSVTKSINSNRGFIKPTIPELNCPRNLSPTVARLRKGHFKVMKISSDNSRSYPICKNCPETQ